LRGEESTDDTRDHWLITIDHETGDVILRLAFSNRGLIQLLPIAEPAELIA